MFTRPSPVRSKDALFAPAAISATRLSTSVQSIRPSSLKSASGPGMLATRKPCRCDSLPRRRSPGPTRASSRTRDPKVPPRKPRRYPGIAKPSLVPFPDVTPLVEGAVEARAARPCRAHGGDIAVLAVPVRTCIVVGDIHARVADVTDCIRGGDGGDGVTSRGVEPVVVRVTPLGGRLIVGRLVPLVFVRNEEGRAGARVSFHPLPMV